MPLPPLAQAALGLLCWAVGIHVVRRLFLLPHRRGLLGAGR